MLFYYFSQSNSNIDQMPAKTIIFLFFIIFSTCFQIKSADDNLSDQIEKARGDEQLLLMSKAINQFLEQGNYEQAYIYIGKSEKLIKKVKNTEIKAELLFSQGEYYYYIDENQRAINKYKEVIQISNNLKGTDIYERSLYKTGLTYYYLNKFDSAISYFNRALVITLKKKDLNLQGKIFEAFARVKRDENNADEAIQYVEKAIEIYSEIRNIEGLANAYNNIGRIFFNIGKDQQAIQNYTMSLNFRKKLNDREGIAIQNVNIGNVYWKLGDYEKAIGFQQEALNFFEEIGHEVGIANTLTNIGVCYENINTDNQGIDNITNYSNALRYYERSLKYRIELADSFEISNSYLNIANIKSRLIDEKYMIRFGNNWNDSLLTRFSGEELLKSYNEPIETYNQSLKIKERLNDVNGIGLIYHNLGKIYSNCGYFNKAFSYFEKSLEISKHTHNTLLEANLLMDIGNAYYSKKNLSLALKNYMLSLNITTKYDYKYITRYVYLALSRIYESLEKSKESLNYYKKYIAVKDSIMSEEKYKQIAELETKYETEKKEKEIQLLNVDNELQKNKVKQARLIIVFISMGIALIMFFLVVVYKQFIAKRKANIKLEAQNRLIKKQKEDITDSITYASRIQSALLPPQELLDKLLKEYFVLYLPKDIVSGDYYWASEYENKVILAVADCTGHGVPGAFMSMLGISFLNEIVNKRTNLKANDILTDLRAYIIKSLRQSMTSATGKDGMDMALTIIDRNSMTIEYAGAFNPLIVCKNGSLIEYKADRMPVGIHLKYDIPFENNIIQIEKGDMFYAFSDGFQDQFGGTDKRKFMVKRLKELFLEIYNEPLEKQKEILHTTHDMWKGYNAQLDDILIIGVKI